MSLGRTNISPPSTSFNKLKGSYPVTKLWTLFTRWFCTQTSKKFSKQGQEVQKCFMTETESTISTCLPIPKKGGRQKFAFFLLACSLITLNLLAVSRLKVLWTKCNYKMLKYIADLLLFQENQCYVT